MTREEYVNILEIDKAELIKENQELKKQLEYLRSGEYLNQLKFERDILQDIVDNGEISKEDKEFIDCTHRNTELLKENQELKKQVEVSNELVAQGTLTEMKLRNEGNRWKKEYQDTYKDVRIEIKEYKTQQKEFIKFLEDEIQTIENKIFNLPVESNERNYLVNIGNKLIEILQKYKEIIGGE